MTLNRQINVGCGSYLLNGYINIDVNPRHEPNICRDVRKGLPFDDDSVIEIVATHFLEHLTPGEMLDFFEESYRVLKNGCALMIVVPLEEPYCIDHLQVFAEWSFDTFGRRETADYFQRKFRWIVDGKRTKPANPDQPHSFDTLRFQLIADKT